MATPPDPADVSAVEMYWKAKLHPGAVRSDTRRNKVRARLREGYTVEQLKRAIDGCAGDKWHRDRKLTDLSLICRDAPHVDRFLIFADGLISGAEVDELETIRKAMREDDDGLE